jgi:hypothetical protein
MYLHCVALDLSHKCFQSLPPFEGRPTKAISFRGKHVGLLAGAPSTQLAAHTEQHIEQHATTSEPVADVSGAVQSDKS